MKKEEEKNGGRRGGGKAALPSLPKKNPVKRYFKRKRKKGRNKQN